MCSFGSFLKLHAPSLVSYRFSWFRMVSHWCPIRKLYHNKMSCSPMSCPRPLWPCASRFPLHLCSEDLNTHMQSWFSRQVIGRWEHHAMTRCLLHVSRNTQHPENPTTRGHQAAIPPPVPGCSHDLSGFQGKPKDPNCQMKPWQSILLSLL